MKRAKFRGKSIRFDGKTVYVKSGKGAAPKTFKKFKNASVNNQSAYHK